MNKRVVYAVAFAFLASIVTFTQARLVLADSEDDLPLTSPITSPENETPQVPEQPITPPVISSPPVSSGGGSNNNSGGGNGSSTCTNEAPKIAPVIFRASTTGRNQITLFYTNPGQTTSYSVVYGTKSGVHTFGLSNINGAQNSVAINGLTRGATYFFKVQGVNGCAAGPFSQEIKIKVGSNVFTPVLGAKTVNKNFKPVKSSNSTPKPVIPQSQSVPAPKNTSFFQSFLNLFN